jgi:hypothetical protein
LRDDAAHRPKVGDVQLADARELAPRVDASHARLHESAGILGR